MPDAVPSANALTARWAATCDGSSTTLSGAGVWPLLALLAAGAEGETRAELEAATGLDAAAAAGAARGLFEALTKAEAVHAALGLWTREELPLERAWLGALPPASHGALTGDRAQLDAWAAEHTRGLIKRMPLQLGPSTLLVLASALAMKTEWARHFTDGRRSIGNGPWAGAVAGLSRNSGELDEVAVTDTNAGRLTVATVAGKEDVDVHLVLGEDGRDAGAVLGAGIAAVAGQASWLPGSALPDGEPGPGIHVADSPALARPTLRLQTVRFTVTGSHNLLAHGDLFGLSSAATDRASFPGISSTPLAVAEAKQDAIAIFSAEGFEAAAITAMGMRAAAAMPMTRGARLVSVDFDRPFGFVATHRPTGLVLVAGWVAEPER